MSDVMILDKKDVAVIATGFIRKSGEVQRAVAELAKTYPEAVHAACAAGEFAILDAMTENDKAFVKRCVKEKKLLCEGGSPPSDDAINRVVAEACAKQFQFPSKQFSVWTNGTLYWKEDGFRRQLQLEGWGGIDYDSGPPQWKVLQDRKYWEVQSWAKATRGGKTERVDCLLGVNGNVSDGIEKVLSHAARSIMKRLYKKCSSINMEFTDEDDSQTIDIVQEQAPLLTQEPVKDQWKPVHETVIARLKDPSQIEAFNGLWNAIADSVDSDALVTVADEIKAAKALLSERDVEELRWFYKHRSESLKA